ncbi:MAG: hypothetical protein BWZ10_02138 [candidate division BRC1 bacterium ADurb.BinA364]|nr:MAG: hypothetical protein BWZ10_02138 [candidate division BRC1 bacterium ADurb.BinA364]
MNTAALTRSARRGVTLIELILVLTILATVAATTSPSLSRFFRGRDLTNESRRLLGLTGYGRSQAVSLGQPMVLWLALETGQYGLEAADPYLAGEMEAMRFQLPDGMRFDAERETVSEDGYLAIYFYSDGSVDGGSFYLFDREEYGVELRPDSVSRGYKIAPLE